MILITEARQKFNLVCKIARVTLLQHIDVEPCVMIVDGVDVVVLVLIVVALLTVNSLMMMMTKTIIYKTPNKSDCKFGFH